MLSSANEKTIRAAIEALQAVLSKVAGGQTAESAEIVAVDDAITEAEAILAQNDSYEGLRMRVQKALTDRHREIRRAAWASGVAIDPEYGAYPWIRDLYDDAVIYEQDSKLYRSDYSVDTDGAVTLADPVAVAVSYVPVETPSSATESRSGVADQVEAAIAKVIIKLDAAIKLHQRHMDGKAPTTGDAGMKSQQKLMDLLKAARAALDDPATKPATETATDLTGDIVPLVEKAVRKDGTTTVKIIQPGWGSSGYYSAEMLERDGPKVFTKGLHMYVDHPTAEEAAQRPERSVRDLGAVLETDATYQANGAAGPGLYADAKVLPAFAANLEALAPHIGTSIRASGKTAVGEADGKRGPIVESLVAAQSVDFVTKPGAGGQVLQLFEAARGRSVPVPSGGRPVDEREAQQLRESNATLTTSLTETQTQLARMQEAMILRDARDVAAETLRTIEMPEMTRTRLLESAIVSPPVKDGALDREAFVTSVKEAATRELAYIASLSGAGAIRGMGSAGASAGDSPQREAATADLTAGFVAMGLSESAAKAAATGRN